MPTSSPALLETSLKKTLHDLAGSLTVLSLNLPELKHNTNRDAFTACQNAVEQARGTLKSAWRELDRLKIL